MNRHILTNLRPGTRYKIKLAPLMNNGKVKGVYTNWVNARTPAGKKPKAINQPFTALHCFAHQGKNCFEYLEPANVTF